MNGEGNPVGALEYKSPPVSPGEMCQYVWTTWTLCAERPNHACLLAVTFCGDVLDMLPAGRYRGALEGTLQLATVGVPDGVRRLVSRHCRRKVETMKQQCARAACPACTGSPLPDKDVLGPWLDMANLPAVANSGLDYLSFPGGATYTGPLPVPPEPGDNDNSKPDENTTSKPDGSGNQA
ncbi:hypothetical protein GGTG_04301 [Gaeumannomyces tritici R3-111a-1]|uniref:Uncharacterized protein n=1 Tax=Gaeumannomyces tritici (strain R3-111a-1) TaxID=644352 RepID=J3NSQ2_GAET3|nr:hypothetical protein GGTG_04301 [Gaeumannomyces tritici R3-111a-1]EJT79215.1 hypothetical protein GGTG_04301 [Gaeumannomyces tritici R3-111a-1]